MYSLLNDRKIVSIDTIETEDEYISDMVKYSQIILLDDKNNKLVLTAESECCDIAWIELDIDKFLNNTIDYIYLFDETINYDEEDINCLKTKIYNVQFKNTDEFTTIKCHDYSNGFYNGIFVLDYYHNDIIEKSNSMIDIIIGLPGSGKTTMINNEPIYNKYIKLDDIYSDLAGKLILEEALKKSQNIVITDPRLIFKSNLKQLLDLIGKYVNIYENVKFIVFEWNIEKCKKNILKRGDNIHRYTKFFNFNDKYNETIDYLDGFHNYIRIINN